MVVRSFNKRINVNINLESVTQAFRRSCALVIGRYWKMPLSLEWFCKTHILRLL